MLCVVCVLCLLFDVMLSFVVCSLVFVVCCVCLLCMFGCWLLFVVCCCMLFGGLRLTFVVC